MTLVGRDIERLLVVVFGGISIILGFRLFYLIKQKQGDLRLQGKDFRLTLGDVAPGVYFALFGSLVLCVNLFSKSAAQRTETRTIESSNAIMTVVTTENRRGVGSWARTDAALIEDPDNDVMREYSPKSKRDDIIKLRAFRNVLRQAVANGTAKDFWRSNACDEIRTVLTPLVDEAYFKTQMGGCNGPEQLRIFLEYYVTFFYHTYSAPAQQ